MSVEYERGLSATVNDLSRSVGIDLGASTTTLFDAMRSWYDDRKHGLRTLAAGVLLGTSLAACGGDSGVNNPPDPDPQPDPSGLVYCVEGSAVEDAANAGLSVDVSIYDNNVTDSAGGCYSNIEEDFVSWLATVERAGKVPVENLEGIVEAFPTVGPITLGGARDSYADFERDVTYEPNLEFNADTIGWIPLGKILSIGGLPARTHDDGVVPRTNFPINEHSAGYGFTDLANKIEGVRKNALSEYVDGAEACAGIAPDEIITSSADMNLIKPYDPETGEWGDLDASVGIGSYMPWTVSYVFLDDTLGPATSMDVGIGFEVLEADRHLVGFSWVGFDFSHVRPENIEAARFGAEDLSFAAGDEHPAEARLPIEVDAKLPGAFYELDYTVRVKAEEATSAITIPGTEFAVLDVLGAGAKEDGEYVYPRDERAGPTEPRYLVPAVHAPCVREDGEWLNLPDAEEF